MCNIIFSKIDRNLLYCYFRLGSLPFEIVIIIKTACIKMITYLVHTMPEHLSHLFDSQHLAFHQCVHRMPVQIHLQCRLRQTSQKELNPHPWHLTQWIQPRLLWSQVVGKRPLHHQYSIYYGRSFPISPGKILQLFHHIRCLHHLSVPELECGIK